MKKIVHVIKSKFSRNYVDVAAHFAKTHNSYRHQTRALKKIILLSIYKTTLLWLSQIFFWLLTDTCFLLVNVLLYVRFGLTDKSREGREAPGSLTQQNFCGKQEKVSIQVRWAGGTVGKVENACMQRKAVHSFDEGPERSAWLGFRRHGPLLKQLLRSEN